MKLASGGLSSRGRATRNSLSVRGASLRRGQRRGAIVVLTAFLIIALLAAVAFSVDVAYMQLVRSELRSNTDLAARAGAEAILRTGNATTARTAAKNIAAANKVAGVGMTLTDSEIVLGRTVRNNDGTMTFTANSTPYNSCQVNAARVPANANGSVGLFFGPVFGVTNFQPRSTATVIRGGKRRDITLVVDRSGSMTERVGGRRSETKWQAMLNAFVVLRTALESTSDDTEMLGLASYSSGSTQDCNPTTNYASVQTILNSKYPSGATNITAGIQAGHPIAQHGRNDADVEKVMVIMTDGLHNQGPGPMTMVNALNANGIKVITITFGADADQTGMAQLAAACNGRHYHAPTSAVLDEIFRNIGLGIDGLQYFQ